MADLDRIKEVNKKALQLDKKLKAIRDEMSALLEQPFVENDVETLKSILTIMNADCLSYYKYRIHNKLLDIKSENNKEGVGIE